MATLAAIGAALAIAPPLAVAKKLQYEGPLNIPRNSGFITFPDGKVVGPFGTYPPTIQFKKVAFDGKTPIRGLIKEFGLWGPCSGYGTTEGDGKHDLNVHFNKKGAFSGHDGGFSATGRITRRSATGTVREVVTTPQTGPNDAEWGTCDTGHVSFTAPRVNQVTAEGDLH